MSRRRPGGWWRRWPTGSAGTTFADGSARPGSRAGRRPRVADVARREVDDGGTADGVGWNLDLGGRPARRGAVAGALAVGSARRQGGWAGRPAATSAATAWSGMPPQPGPLSRTAWSAKRSAIRHVVGDRTAKSRPCDRVERSVRTGRTCPSISRCGMGPASAAGTCLGAAAMMAGTSGAALRSIPTAAPARGPPRRRPTGPRGRAPGPRRAPPRAGAASSGRAACRRQAGHRPSDGGQDLDPARLLEGAHGSHESHGHVAQGRRFNNPARHPPGRMQRNP